MTDNNSEEEVSRTGAGHVDLGAIEARCDKATRGPWVIVWSQLMENARAHFNPWRRVLVGTPKPEGSGKDVLTGKYVTEITQLAQTDEGDKQAIDDAKFIAHARTDVPALLEEVRRLRRVLALAEKCVGSIGRRTSDWNYAEVLYNDVEELRAAIEVAPATTPQAAQEEYPPRDSAGDSEC